MTDYSLVCSQLSSLLEGSRRPLSAMANCAALLWQSLEDLNWAGFYLLSGDTLCLGPFQGKPACTEIRVGRGVCGTCVRTGEIQVVPDVHQFPGHIACDSASRSELVVPLRRHGRVWGVLDIDSPLAGRFSPEDQTGLEAFAAVLERCPEL